MSYRSLMLVVGFLAGCELGGVRLISAVELPYDADFVKSLIADLVNS